MPTIQTPSGGYISYVRDLNDNQMKQIMYNIERANERRIKRTEKEIEKEIKESIRKAMNRLERNIDGYYRRYATKEGISPIEARRLASEFDIRAWEQAAARAVKYRDFSPETNAWLRMYNLKMRASREEAMLQTAYMDLITMYGEIEELGAEAITSAAIEETKRQAGILGGAPVVEEEMKRLVLSDFNTTDGYSKLIWGVGGHYDKLHRELTEIMTDMHVDADGYRRHWRNLAERMNVAESNAKRLIITEERRMLSKARLETYEKNDFDMYVYVAEPGACDICNALADKVFYTRDAMEGANFPTMHPFCACTTYGYKPMQRLNKETGQWEAVDPRSL